MRAIKYGITGIGMVTLGAVVLFAVGSFLCSLLDVLLGFPDGKLSDALDQSGKIARACDAYRMKPLANGKYPARLLDLIEPPAGIPPTLDGGRSAIISPWGKQYKFGTVETEGGQVLYVWTEFEADGKVTLIGSKRGPNGRHSYFGRPD